MNNEPKLPGIYVKGFRLHSKRQSDSVPGFPCGSNTSWGFSGSVEGADASGSDSGITYGVGPGNDSGEGPEGASIAGSAEELGVDSGLFAATYKSN